MSTPRSPETLAWLHQAAAAGFAEPMVLRHVMQRLDALEAPGRPDAEAWSSARRIIRDLRLRLLRLEAAQQQPPDHLRSATEMVSIPDGAQVATDDELFDLFHQHDPLPIVLRGIYNLGRQHGAAQPPAAQPTPPIAPAKGLLERVASYCQDDQVFASSAIHEVAEWLDLEGYSRAASDMREEVAE